MVTGLALSRRRQASRVLSTLSSRKRSWRRWRGRSVRGAQKSSGRMFPSPARASCSFCAVPPSARGLTASPSPTPPLRSASAGATSLRASVFLRTAESFVSGQLRLNKVAAWPRPREQQEAAAAPGTPAAAAASPAGHGAHDAAGDNNAQLTLFSRAGSEAPGEAIESLLLSQRALVLPGYGAQVPPTRRACTRPCIATPPTHSRALTRPPLRAVRRRSSPPSKPAPPPRVPAPPRRRQPGPAHGARGRAGRPARGGASRRRARATRVSIHAPDAHTW